MVTPSLAEDPTSVKEEELRSPEIVGEAWRKPITVNENEWILDSRPKTADTQDEGADEENYEVIDQAKDEGEEMSDTHKSMEEENVDGSNSSDLSDHSGESFYSNSRDSEGKSRCFCLL